MQSLTLHGLMGHYQTQDYEEVLYNSDYRWYPIYYQTQKRVYILYLHTGGNDPVDISVDLIKWW